MVSRRQSLGWAFASAMLVSAAPPLASFAQTAPAVVNQLTELTD